MKNLPNHFLATLLWLGLIVVIPSTTLAQSTNQNRIALVMKALSNPFFAKMEAGAKDYAAETGVALEIFGIETETDIERQISIVNHLISRGYGAIVIAPAHSHALVPILKKAIQQGIIVINIDNPLDPDLQAQYGLNIPFVGADNAKGAELIGNYIRRQLHGKGRIIVIGGASGARNGELRKIGFLQSVTGDSGIEIVASVESNWHTEDAFAKMSKFLDQHNAVDAVFCANDQMALGVLQALDIHRLIGKVLVTGYDNTEAARNELRNHRMHATVEQHPELMGRLGVALAHQAMQGKKIPIRQEIPLDMITHDSFGRQIALSLSEQANPFFAALLKGAQAEAEQHGADLVLADANNDIFQQLIVIRDFVNKPVDVLIINPTDSQAVRPGIELANRAHVPVITVDRKADGGAVISHITSDNISGGRLAADYIAHALNKGGVIAEFEGIPGTSASYERGKGFNDTIAQHKNLRIAVREVANFSRDDANKAMQRLLAQQQKFDAIFAHNDNMILGVMDALQQAHPTQYPILVGFDAIPEVKQAIQDGRVAATIEQKPERMGALAVETAVQSLRGEPTPDFIAVELALFEGSDDLR